MSKGLEALTELKRCVASAHLNTRDFVDIAFDVEKASNAIEKELKAFEIIDKKSVVVELVRKTDNVEAYNFAIKDDNYAIALTQEEYDLLKEVLS